jgi:ABC-type cobalamin/Fe3+-siderophores transport system ATPase subunit
MIPNEASKNCGAFQFKSDQLHHLVVKVKAAEKVVIVFVLHALNTNETRLCWELVCLESDQTCRGLPETMVTKTKKGECHSSR